MVLLYDIIYKVIFCIEEWLATLYFIMRGERYELQKFKRKT